MPRKILIVDDLATNRLMLGGMLKKEYDILEAASGEAALDILLRGREAVSAVLLDIGMPGMDGYEVLSHIRADAKLARLPVIMITGSDDEETRVKSLTLGASDFVMKPYKLDVIKHCLKNNIALQEAAATVDALQRDRLTGLYNRETFFDKADKLIAASEPGSLVLGCVDIDRFKVINDQYGSDAGDRVLKLLADALLSCCTRRGGMCGRIFADRFVSLYPIELLEQNAVGPQELEARIHGELGVNLTLSVGRYIVSDKSLSASAMYDRAAIAQSTVKGRYDIHAAVYDEGMRGHIVREQEIVNGMNAALRERCFEVWFQPQYNHSTGARIGAEALVRWRHPQRGVLSPGEFIPVFERNGFVYTLDKFVWEEVCRCLRKWLDEGRAPLPVSVNISRYDIFCDDLISTLTGLVEKYSLPRELLRLEITESAFAGSSQHIVAIARELVELGFTVEIDDFGSGYSSLNTLKDVPAQIIKLDMKFLENSSDTRRGGNILESIVRMAKWLGISVIAEGVETVEQADFLRSVGCSYVQGYLYARPMPANEYEEYCALGCKEERLLALETVENLDNDSFWDPNSMDTLIFNSFVGGACVFEYHRGRIELVRATKKYAQLIGSSTLTVEEALKLDWLAHMDEDSRRRVNADLQESIATRREVTGEYIFLDLPGCPHEIYLRSTLRVIAAAGERYLVYCTNDNITAQREAERSRLRIAEQVEAIMRDIRCGITAATVDSDGMIELLFTNDRFFELHGYTREQYEAEIKDKFDCVHPDDRDKARRDTVRAYSTRTPVQLEYRLILRDGSVRWVKVELSSTNFTGIEQNVHLCIFTDITDEKQARETLLETDAQLRFLNDMSHELLAQPDVETGINAVLERLMEHFEGARAYIFEFNNEKAVAANTYEVCAPGVSAEKDSLQEVPFELMDLWFEGFEKQGYYAIEDVAALDDSRAAERERLLIQGISSVLVVPIRRDGELIGMIGVDDPHLRYSQAKRMMALGDYLAVMLTRRDLSARIKNDNEILSGMMNDMPGGFARMRVEPDGGIKPVFFNEGFTKLTGMSGAQLEKLYSLDLLSGIHPDDMAVVNGVIERMLERGEAHSSRCRLRHGKGDYIWASIFGRRTTDAAGVTHLNIYFTDVTDQIREEETQRALLDNLPGGAGLYDYSRGKLCVVYLNRSYWELVGRMNTNYSELDPMAAAHPEDMPLIAREIETAIAQGRDMSCDFRLLSQSEGYYPVHLVGRIVPRGQDSYSIYTTFHRIT